MNRGDSSIPEPWLRGTLTEVPAVGRGVLHALELPLEDAMKWCSGFRKIPPSHAVGSKRLPTTLGGLLVHIADHTQRHVGQMTTTAKLVSASKVL